MSLIFSKRNNIVPIKNLQEDSIDDDLKNQLWNFISLLFFKEFTDYTYNFLEKTHKATIKPII